jgi:hypothetical protein
MFGEDASLWGGSCAVLTAAGGGTLIRRELRL